MRYEVFERGFTILLGQIFGQISAPASKLCRFIIKIEII